MISRCILYLTGSLLLLSTILQKGSATCLCREQLYLTNNEDILADERQPLQFSKEEKPKIQYVYPCGCSAQVLPYHLEVPGDQTLQRSNELVYKAEPPETTEQKENMISLEYNLENEEERPHVILTPYEFSWEKIFKSKRQLNPNVYNIEILPRLKPQHQKIRNLNAPEEAEQKNRRSETSDLSQFLRGFPGEIQDGKSKHTFQRRKREVSEEILMAKLNASSESDDRLNYPVTLPMEEEHYSLSRESEYNLDTINQSNNMALDDSSGSHTDEYSFDTYDTSDEITDEGKMALVTPAPRKSLNKKYSDILGLNFPDTQYYSANNRGSKCKSGSCKQRQNSRDLGYSSLSEYQDNSEISPKAILDTNEDENDRKHFKPLWKTSYTRHNEDYLNKEFPFFKNGLSTEEFQFPRERFTGDEDYYLSSENWKALDYPVPYYALDEYSRLQKEHQENSFDRRNEGFRYKRVGDYSNSNIWDKYHYPKTIFYNTNSDLPYYEPKIIDDLMHYEDMTTANDQTQNENGAKISKPIENSIIPISYRPQKEFSPEETNSYLDSVTIQSQNGKVQPLKETLDSGTRLLTHNEELQQIQKTVLNSTSDQIQNEGIRQSNEIKKLHDVLYPGILFGHPEPSEGISSNINSGSLEEIVQETNTSQNMLVDEVTDKYMPALDTYSEDINFGIAEKNYPSQELMEFEITQVPITTDSSIENILSGNTYRPNINESERFIKKPNSENSYITQEKGVTLNTKQGIEENSENWLNPNDVTDNIGYSSEESPKIPRYIVDEVHLKETPNLIYDGETKWPSWFIPEKHLIKKTSTYDVPLPIEKLHPHKIKHVQIHEPEQNIVKVIHRNKYDFENKDLLQLPIHDNWVKQSPITNKVNSLDRVAEYDKPLNKIPKSEQEEHSLSEYYDYLTLLKSLEQIPVKNTNSYKPNESGVNKQIYNILVPDTTVKTPIWKYNPMPEAIHEKYITKEINVEGNIIHNDYLYPGDKRDFIEGDSKEYATLKIKYPSDVSNVIPFRSTTKPDWFPLPPNNKLYFADTDITNTADMYSTSDTNQYLGANKKVNLEQKQNPYNFVGINPSNDNHNLIEILNTKINSHRPNKATDANRDAVLNHKHMIDINKGVEHGDNCEEIVKLLLAEGKEELMGQDYPSINLYHTELNNNAQLSEASDNIKLLSHRIKQPENIDHPIAEFVQKIENKHKPYLTKNFKNKVEIFDILPIEAGILQDGKSKKYLPYEISQFDFQNNFPKMAFNYEIQDYSDDIIKSLPYDEKFHIQYLKTYNPDGSVDIKIPSANKKLKNNIETNEHFLLKNKPPTDKQQLTKILASIEAEKIAGKELLPHKTYGSKHIEEVLSILPYKNINKIESEKYLPFKTATEFNNDEYLKMFKPTEIGDINLENKYLIENDHLDNKDELLKQLLLKKMIDKDNRNHPHYVISSHVKDVLPIPPNHSNKLFETEYLFNNLEKRGEIFKINSILSEKKANDIQEKSILPLKLKQLTNIYDDKIVSPKQSGDKHFEIKNIPKDINYLDEKDKILKLTPPFRQPNKPTEHISEVKLSYNKEKKHRYENKHTPYISDISKDIIEGYSTTKKPGKLIENNIGLPLKINHSTNIKKVPNLPASREEAKMNKETQYLPPDVQHSEEFSDILNFLLSSQKPHKVIAHKTKHIYENGENVEGTAQTQSSEEKNHKLEHLTKIPSFQKENHDSKKSLFKTDKLINHPGVANAILHKNKNIKNDLHEHDYPLYMQHVDTIKVLNPEKFNELDIIGNKDYLYRLKPNEAEVGSIEIKPEYFPKLKDKIRKILVKYNPTSMEDEYLKDKEDIPEFGNNYKFAHFEHPGNSKFNKNTSSMEHAHKEYKLIHKLSHHKPLLDELKMHIDSLQELKVVDELVNSNLYKDAAHVQIEEAMHSVETGSKENGKNDIYATSLEVEDSESNELEDSHISENDILALIKSLRSDGHRRESDIKLEDAINVCRKIRKLIGKGISKENFKSLILKLLNNTEVLHNPNEALKIIKHYKILNSDDRETKKEEIEESVNKDQIYGNLGLPFVEHKKMVIYEDDKSFPPKHIPQTIGYKIIKPKINIEKFAIVKNNENGNNNEIEEQYVHSSLLDKILTITNKTPSPNQHENNENIEAKTYGINNGKNSNKLVYQKPETSQEVIDENVEMICEKYYGLHPSIYKLCDKLNKGSKAPDDIEVKEKLHISTEQPSVYKKYSSVVIPIAEELPGYLKVQKEYSPFKDNILSHFKEFNVIPYSIEEKHHPYNFFIEKYYSDLKKLKEPTKQLLQKSDMDNLDDKKYTCFDILKLISGREKELIKYFKDDKEVIKALVLQRMHDIPENKKKPSCTEILRKLKSRGLCSDEEFENIANELLQIDNLKKPKFDKEELNFKNYLYHQHLNKSVKLVDMQDTGNDNNNYYIPNSNTFKVSTDFDDHSKISLYDGETKMEYTDKLPIKDLIPHDLKIGAINPLYKSNIIQEIQIAPSSGYKDTKKLHIPNIRYDYLGSVPNYENQELDDIILKNVLSMESAKIENKKYEITDLITNEEIDKFINKLLNAMKIKQHAMLNKIEEIASIVEKWCRLKLSNDFTKEKLHISQGTYEKLRKRILHLILKKVYDNTIHYHYSPEDVIKPNIPYLHSSPCHNSKCIHEYKIPPIPIAKHEHLIVKPPLPVYPTLENGYFKHINELHPVHRKLYYDKLLLAHPHNNMIDGDHEHYTPHHTSNIHHLSHMRPKREITGFQTSNSNDPFMLYNNKDEGSEGEISKIDTKTRQKSSLPFQCPNNKNMQRATLETQVKPPPVIL